MNVAILLSGGCGKRFGASVPKQYLNLNGKPVIEYVIEAVLNTQAIDEIVLVIDKEYLSYVKEIGNNRIHVVSNGEERLDSVFNALNYINNNYSCENVIILQAVSPFITSDLIDEYIHLLKEYEVVTTAEKCKGEIFNIQKYAKINRNDYYFCQSPEAFKFKDLFHYIDTKSKYSELIYHYPYEPKIYYYLNFLDNIKITYPADLEYARFLMSEKNRNDNR